MAPSSASSRASSHSSNTWAWSSVAGKSVRTKPASGLRAKNQRRKDASVAASSDSAGRDRREISDRIKVAGETGSRFKERTWFIRFSKRKSGEPRRRSLVLAGAPKREKRLLMQVITTRVKNES